MIIEYSAVENLEDRKLKYFNLFISIFFWVAKCNKKKLNLTIFTKKITK
jgi:F0F1-type ATP synthase membrane subunit a